MAELASLRTFCMEEIFSDMVDYKARAIDSMDFRRDQLASRISDFGAARSGKMSQMHHQTFMKAGAFLDPEAVAIQQWNAARHSLLESDDDEEA